MDLKNQKASSSRVEIGRRLFLIGAGAGLAGFAWLNVHGNEPVLAEAEAAGLPKTVTIVEFTDSGERKGKVSVERVEKSEEDWKKQLSAASFEVTRRAGTERAFTNDNPNDHAKGIFRCICCDTALFDSKTKFDSGTGWPSFWQPIAKENVRESSDTSLGMVRTAVSCRLCEAHLGHVFDDGPKPTGLRYCMNSVAMRFVKVS